MEKKRERGGRERRQRRKEGVATSEPDKCWYSACRRQGCAGWLAEHGSERASLGEDASLQQGWTQGTRQGRSRKQARRWSGTQDGRTDAGAGKSRRGQKTQKAGWGQSKMLRTQRALTQKQISKSSLKIPSRKTTVSKELQAKNPRSKSRF